MLNAASDQAVASSWWTDRFRMPLHDAPQPYSYAGISPSIEHLLTGEGAFRLPPDVLGEAPARYDKVVLLFIDAFGWSFYTRHVAEQPGRYPALARLLEAGTVSRLTAQFPSTTTAHVTSMVYGQPVGQHGLYEWNCYEPLVDRLIVPLMWSYANDALPNLLRLPLHVSPASFVPGETLFRRLAARGVKSYVATARELFGVTTSQLAFAGTVPIGYKTPAEGLALLAEAVRAEPGQAFYWFYYAGIDSVCHTHGPDHPATKAEIDAFLTLLDQQFLAALPETGGRSLVLLTADHGQVGIDPDTTLYLNHHAPELERLIARGAEGRLLVPAGSSRDLFLHIREAELDAAYDLLRALPALDGKAEVYRTRDLIDAGLFAGGASPELLRRVGNLVVLPYAGESAWWDVPGHNLAFRGHHGGLTPDEIDIPLLVLPV
jgi:predicted AlkP superfamily pyrophosphatase or phosphodiesterase